MRILVYLRFKPNPYPAWSLEAFLALLIYSNSLPASALSVILAHQPSANGKNIHTVLGKWSRSNKCTLLTLVDIRSVVCVLVVIRLDIGGPSPPVSFAMTLERESDIFTGTEAESGS